MVRALKYRALLVESCTFYLTKNYVWTWAYLMVFVTLNLCTWLQNHRRDLVQVNLILDHALKPLIPQSLDCVLKFSQTANDFFHNFPKAL